MQLIKEITVDGVIYKRNEIQNSRTLKVNRADSTSLTKATCDYIDVKTHPERIVCIEESIDLLLVVFCNSRVLYLVIKRDESRKVIAQQAKQLSIVQVAMTPGEERIQAQKVTEAKETRLQKCADQKAKLLADLSENKAANERAIKIKVDAEKAEDDMLSAAYDSFFVAKHEVSTEVVAAIINSLVDSVIHDTKTAEVAKIDESGFFSDTEATTPKITLLAKSAAKLAKIAQYSAAANAGSFVEQNPDQIVLEECLTIISNAETNACNSGVKRSSRL